LHPSMRELSEPLRSKGQRLSTVRVAMLATALVTAPAVLLIQAALGSGIDAVPIAIGAGVLGGLVLLRLTSMIHALDVLRVTEGAARAEAETAQRLLTEQNERLREADRLKDEFVALISHDLRTPLTSITGYVELALEEDLADDVRGFLQVVARNSDRLLRLVNDLLFVARLQAGDMMLEQEHLDLAEIVRDGVKAMEPRAAAKDITLSCVVDAVSAVHVDRGRFMQVLDNLVSNALKFTPEGGEVHIRLQERDGTVRLEVSDSGMGITAADQRRLFERFFRAGNAVEQQVPGTGLGLYICRAIAEAHEGTISVRSELGEGSTFRLELPAVRAAVPA
jgi:signal transduction histidine kinase